MSRVQSTLLMFLGMFALVAVGAGATAFARQDVTTALIEDTDYQFTLRRPGRDWILLPEAEVQALSPDAVAGARLQSKSSVHGFIIVEPYPTADLDAYVKLVYGNMSVEGKHIVQQRDTTIQGVAAKSLLIEGKANGLDVRYQLVAFVRGGFAYQLLGAGLAAVTASDGSSFAPFFAAFGLLDGPIQARVSERSTPDMVRTSWRVRSNVFESAASGVRLAPPSGWRLVVGDELREMNDDAEVGMIHGGDVAIYLTITSEMAAGVDAAALTEQYVKGLTQGHGVKGDRTSEARVLDEPITFRVVESTAAQGYDMSLATFWVGPIACQLNVWYATSDAKRAWPVIRSALASIETLAADELQALRDALQTTGYRHQSVGPTHVLRNGIMQDFETGVRWSTPPGLAKVLSGQAARAQAGESMLWIEEPSLGLFGLLRYDRGLSMDAAAYHNAVLETMWDEATAEALSPKARVIERAGNRSLRVSQHTLPQNGQSMTHVVASGSTGDVGVRLQLWGYAGNVERATAWIEQAVKRLVLDGAPKTASQLRGDLFHGPSDGLHGTRAECVVALSRSDPGFDSSGRFACFVQRKDQILQYLVMMNLGLEQNTKHVMDAAVNNATRHYPGTPIRRPHTLHGLEGELRIWNQRARVFAASRGRTLYVVIHEWKPGATPIDQDVALSTFGLIETK